MESEEILTRTVAALRTLSANDLQRLAEDMACVALPNVDSQTLTRRGRNEEAQTTKGWPDAYVVTAPNAVFGIEATRQGTWAKHLAEDLEKAKDRDEFNLSGYFFVGGYPDNDPPSKEIANWTKKFIDLGIPANKITILVGKHLALELQQPKYAQVRQSVLKIPSTPDAFRLLLPGLLQEDNLGEFQPTEDDFSNDRVRTPGVLIELTSRLEKDFYVVVRGFGAAGKTTLAQLVARARKPLTSYYLDLATLAASDTSDAKMDLVEWSAAGVLFVVDNIHQSRSVAQDLYQHWRQYGKPRNSRLLLLGRHTLSEASNSVFPNPLLLIPGEDEMLGVVGRLFERENLKVPSLPTGILKQWVDLFGGGNGQGIDLIAFSAAVHGRMADFKMGNYRLSTHDSVEAVRTRYLSRLSERERENLLRLAALAADEIPLPRNALPHPQEGLDISQKLGTVVVLRFGRRDVRSSYALIHPALGSLIAAAVTPQLDVRNELLSIATSLPGIGIRLHSIAKVPLQEVLRDRILSALGDVSWVSHCHTLVELTAVLRWMYLKRLCSGPPGSSPFAGKQSEFDLHLLESQHLVSLIRNTRALSTINDLLARLRDLQLDRTVGWLFSDSMLLVVAQDFASSNTSEIVTFLLHHPTPGKVLNEYSLNRWNDLQDAVPAQTVTNAVSSFRYLEKLGRGELAVTPARKILATHDDVLLRSGAHLAHVAHLIRYAKNNESAASFVGWLLNSSNMRRMSQRGSIRHLSGALLSLANHLAISLRISVLDVLESRVTGEINQLTGRAEPKAAIPTDAEVICMLGGYAALGGSRAFEALRVADFTGTADLFSSKLLDAAAETMGTYELQLWLGIKACFTHGIKLAELPTDRLARFASRLSQSSPPTDSARVLKAELLAWIETQQPAEK